jgi:hypothetical protein
MITKPFLSVVHAVVIVVCGGISNAGMNQTCQIAFFEGQFT